MSKPEFSQDWFSNNIDSWHQYVLPQLKRIKFPQCLEIGAFEGRSSVFLLENIPGLHLTVVDPWCFTANSTYGNDLVKNAEKYPHFFSANCKSEA
ncbi:MAG: hypothetical protein KGN31_01865 [Betaproteobacteria bacterium]|nr:hypothetical protein [Betaproteobacteria bacterium]